MLRNVVVVRDIDHEFIEREVLDSSTEIRVRTIHVDPLILSFDTMMVGSTIFCDEFGCFHQLAILQLLRMRMTSLSTDCRTNISSDEISARPLPLHLLDAQF
jgi:hypothetical protein